MAALAHAGWKTLTLAQFADQAPAGANAADSVGAQRAAPLPSRNERSFLLTFDDGYASLAQHAYPVLAELGFTATTFLITDYVGKTNTWDVHYTWNRLRHLGWTQIEE